MDLFHSKLIANMDDAAMQMESTWVNAERSQFIWIRSYGDSRANYQNMDAAFKGRDWWQSKVNHVRSHTAHMEVV